MRNQPADIPDWAGANNDGRYYYWDGLAKGKGRRVQLRGGKNREQALTRLREKLADLERGFDLNIDINTTWATLLQKWVEAHDQILTEGTIRTRKSAIDARIMPAIGSVLLVQTNITTVSKVVDFCVAKKTVSAITLEGTVTTLKVVGEWAADRGYLKEDPFGTSQRISKVLRKGKSQIDERGESNDSSSEIKPMSACPKWSDVTGLALAGSVVVSRRTDDSIWAERMAAGLRVSAGTGLRMCELLGLTVEDVDLERGVIKLWRQLYRYAAVGNVRKFAPLKHRKLMKRSDFRPVIVWAKVKDDLKFLIENADTDGNLFPTPETAKWLADWWGSVLAEAREQSGFSWKPHWLRHHYGSYSCASREDGGLGLSYAKVQASLGHKKLETTMNTYVHMIDDENMGWVE